MTSPKIIFFRHGQCQGGNILRGKTDVALSDMGWQQMQLSTNKVLAAHSIPNKIVSSPLQRCRLFAEAKATQFKLNLAIVPALAEFDYGDWDGQTFERLYQKSPRDLNAFFNHPWQNPPPNGEKMPEFEARINNHYSSLCVTAQTHSIIWVFTHGGVMKQILAYILGLDRQASVFSSIDIPYAASITTHLCWDKEKCYSRIEFGN